MKRSMLIAGLCAAFSLNASAALISSDDFNGTDYGPHNTDINGQSGGSGAWASNVWNDGTTHVRWVNTVLGGMTSSATGYTNTGTDDGQMVRYFSGTKYPWRTYSSAINSGNVWVSYINQRTSVDSISDYSSMRFRDGGGNWVYIGSQSDDFGIGNSPTVATDQTLGVYTSFTAHLIVAKIDLSDGSVDAWLNPSDVTTEATLGTADASVTAAMLGFTMTSLDGVMGIVAGENTNAWEAWDAMRIGTELVDVVPEPATLGLVGFVAMGALLIRRTMMI